MNAEANGEARETASGPEGSSPRGAFSPWLGPEMAAIVPRVAPQFGVLLLNNREFNFAVLSHKKC